MLESVHGQNRLIQLYMHYLNIMLFTHAYLAKVRSILRWINCYVKSGLRHADFVLTIFGVLSLCSSNITFAKETPAATPEERDFVRASESLEERLRKLQSVIFSNDSRKLNNFHERALNFHYCWEFARVDLYANFSSVIDSINTEPFKEINDFRRDRYDNEILSDPRKIAVEIRAVISSLRYKKQYLPPLQDFAIKISLDHRLRLLCRAYLSDHR